MTTRQPITNPTLRVRRATEVTTPRFRLQRLDGELGEPLTFESPTVQLGFHPMNDLEVAEPTVSRFHCELRSTPDGVLIKDLGSANGTVVDGLRVKEAYLRDGSVLTLGRAQLRFSLPGELARTRLSPRTSFGPLVGVSTQMRECFSLLEKAAATSRPVLLEGESGTGKTLAGEALHEASSRAKESFLSVDCSSLPEAQLEAALFGRERDETGPRRIGLFEEAGKGTLFLEEVGELPSKLQGRLVQVLEEGVVQRGDTPIHVKARVLASSRRDLRTAVNAGQFRPELFFRLAVLRVVMPALRHRIDDLPLLVETLAPTLQPTREQLAQFLTPEFVSHLQMARWPGNVRELLNHLERCMLMGEAVPVSDTHPSKTVRNKAVDTRLTYAMARDKALAGFEKEYLAALLSAHRGKVAQAAKAADIDRVYLYRLLRRHGLKTKE